MYGIIISFLLQKVLLVRMVLGVAAVVAAVVVVVPPTIFWVFQDSIAAVPVVVAVLIMNLVIYVELVVLVVAT